MDMKTVGELIARKRKDLGITRSELAERLNVSEKTISEWEDGLSCPSTSLFVRLADLLHMTVDEFIRGGSCSSHVICDKDEVSDHQGDISVYSAPVRVDSDARGFVSPFLFGENLEHTRSDVFHGISAQMLLNRKFAGKPERYHGCMMKWYPIGEDVFFSQDEPYTRHCKNYHMTRPLELSSQNIVNCAAGVPAGIGQHELAFTAGKTYEFRAVIKSEYKFTLTVALTSRFGKTVYCKSAIEVDEPGWTTYTCILEPDASDPDGDIRVYFTDDISVTIGALSLMPADNFRGMRKDVIEKLREMGVSVLRWPGGNFAGEYCWEDGLMPCDMRAPFASYQTIETQPHSMGYDYHEINIDDFILLCREIGAEPFITINPVWNTPEEDAYFVEYCNGDASTEYGRKRIARGFNEPFGVKLWSLGNEMGYGHMEGDKSPAGYCRIAKANAEAMLKADPTLTLCSSGPYPNRDWADNSAKPLSKVAPFVSLHYYASSPTYRDKATLKSEYYNALDKVEHMRRLAHRMHNELDNGLMISFDEWNNWYAWYHQSYIYNGIFSALAMHMFMQEADASGIAQVCHFEAVNEGMIEVFENESKLTAAGQIFAVMSRHKCGELVHISRFAAVTRHGSEYIATLINASFDEEKTFVLPKYTSKIESKLYFGAKVKPYSYFEEKDFDLVETSGGFEAIVPAHSVLFIRFA